MATSSDVALWHIADEIRYSSGCLLLEVDWKWPGARLNAPNYLLGLPGLDLARKTNETAGISSAKVATSKQLWPPPIELSLPGPQCCCSDHHDDPTDADGELHHKAGGHFNENDVSEKGEQNSQAVNRQ